MVKRLGSRPAGAGMLVLAAFAFLGSRAQAVYLDPDQNVSLRARIYSQAGVRLEDSQVDTVPETEAGQLVQHRNFYNPELDAKLTPYTTWMAGTPLRWLAPDDLRFRVAAWGFYDGIYDYGSSQFGEQQRLVNSTIGDFQERPRRAWFIEGPELNPAASTLSEIFPDAEGLRPRDIYANDQRVNELYLSYVKGPLFVRLGRQSISWGESDTIALLDQNNPFDTTLAAPGIFQDLEEARIPLWTLRASYNLFDVFGPFSSGAVEAYWVPGDIDTNTGTLPLLTASPYSPRGDDPQNNPALQFLPVQFVLFDHIPPERFENSRWGVRLQTVVNRFFTVQAWYYTHFPNAPVPRKAPLVPVADSGGTQLFITETVHELTAVVGLANTFFFEPLDGIVRMEAEYFDNEPAFVPEINLGIGNPAVPNQLALLEYVGDVPKADFLRWEVGFDRFFFLRFLNPANSFTLVSAVVGSWNLSETSVHDFRFAGQRKPGTEGLSPDDFVQLKPVEVFVQSAIQTDYMHGRLTPRMTTVLHSRGTYLLHPTIDYRWADWLIFNVGVIHIGGAYQSFGFFRDRDQASFRVTFQLN